jgi:hypothetical protein
MRKEALLFLLVRENDRIVLVQIDIKMVSFRSHPPISSVFASCLPRLSKSLLDTPQKKVAALDFILRDSIISPSLPYPLISKPKTKNELTPNPIKCILPPPQHSNLSLHPRNFTPLLSHATPAIGSNQTRIMLFKV